MIALWVSDSPVAHLVLALPVPTIIISVGEEEDILTRRFPVVLSHLRGRIGFHPRDGGAPGQTRPFQGEPLLGSGSQQAAPRPTPPPRDDDMPGDDDGIPF
jgi:hypothetical protein